MKPFVILATPRSRTYWLSQFLSSPRRPVEHEPSRRMRSRGEIRAYFTTPNAAAADTGLGLVWNSLGLEGVTTVIVHRPAAEVLASLRGVGLSTAGIEHYALMLWGINGHHINVADLDNENSANDLYRLCTEREPPPTRWRDMIGQNLQCDIEALRRDVHKNAEGLRAIYEGV